MKLYEYADIFSQLFDSLDAIADFTPEQDEDGRYIDDDGNIIPDIDAYKADMLTAWFDTLDGIEEEFECKAENIACFILQLDGELEMLKKRKAAFERRRRAKENEISRLRGYLMDCMKKIGRNEVKTPELRISIRNNAQSAQIPDEKAFIDMCISKGLNQYLRYKQPEINKTAVKKALQSDVQIEGAALVRSQSLSIR